MEHDDYGDNIARLARALAQIEKFLERMNWSAGNGAGWSEESWFSGVDPKTKLGIKEARGSAREILRAIARDEALPEAIDRGRLTEVCMSVRQDCDFDVPAIRKVIDHAALVLMDPARLAALQVVQRSVEVLRIVCSTRQIFYKGHQIDVSTTPYRLLEMLARSPGTLVSHELLIKKASARGEQFVGSPSRWAKDHKLRLMDTLRGLVGRDGITKQEIDGLISARKSCLVLNLAANQVTVIRRAQ
jgi:hypothetical protein